MKTFPSLRNEISLWEKGFTVIGIDEVGRGAFAGPLVVGAVAFKPNLDKTYIQWLEKLGINDSKKLTKLQRETLAKVIRSECIAYEYGVINVTKINKIGIGKATHMAIRKAVKNMCEKNSFGKKFLLIDAFYIKHINGIGLKNQKGIIRGDQISISIAAASIIAKVKRDKMMKKVSSLYPVYKLDVNKGYGTSEHRLAIRNFGASDLHRTAFVQTYLSKKKTKVAVI